MSNCSFSYVSLSPFPFHTILHAAIWQCVHLMPGIVPFDVYGHLLTPHSAHHTQKHLMHIESNERWRERAPLKNYDYCLKYEENRCTCKLLVKLIDRTHHSEPSRHIFIHHCVTHEHEADIIMHCTFCRLELFFHEVDNNIRTVAHRARETILTDIRKRRGEG